MHAHTIAKLAGLTALAAAGSSTAQPVPTAAAAALADFATYCASSVRLWGTSLCGPVIVVDPETRLATANRDPGIDGFKRNGTLWTGTLPKEVSVANTAITLGGKRFAEVLLPLPDDRTERRVLLAHEAFHRIQPALGFEGRETDNGHLDSKDGRIFARLEIAALEAALTRKEWQPAARDALVYRQARLALTPGAEAAETSLIANEGLAEYTGVKVGAGTRADAMALKRLDGGAARQSLIRTFGYVVGPAYGLLLDRTGRQWRPMALKGSPLPKQLARTVGAPATAASMTRYGGDQIVAEETARDQKIKQRRAELTAALVDGPNVTFTFEKMSIAFDPNTLFALGPAGTSYSRATTIRDNWGVLKVSGDVLVARDWSSARVPGPVHAAGQEISGRGWSATLGPGYRLSKGAREGDFLVAKV